MHEPDFLTVAPYANLNSALTNVLRAVGACPHLFVLEPNLPGVGVVRCLERCTSFVVYGVRNT